MIKPKYLIAMCGFAFFMVLAFMSSGVSYGQAPVSSAVAPAVGNPVTCNIGAPDGSVVGAITQATGLFYGPDAKTNVGGGITLIPGSKWFVVGQDATHKFYKVYISCGFAWIPVGAIGPSPDAPAAGMPLPTRVVS